MQLRELLNSQQILTPLVSAKPMGQDSSMDAFNQILTEKTNDSATRRNTNHQRLDSQNVQPKEKKNFNIKTDSIKFEPAEKSEAAPEKKEFSKVNESKPKKTETERSTDTEQDKIRKILKEKLKRSTGLNDAEIDELITSVLAEPMKLLEMFNSNEAFVSELSDLMTGLELTEVLEKDLSTQDLRQILNQLEQLIQTLEKAAKHSEGRVDPVMDNDEDLQPFEMKIIQSLSKILSTLQNQNDETIDIKPNDIQKMIVEALIIPSDKHVQVIQNETKPVAAPVIANDLLSQSLASPQTVETSHSQVNQVDDASVSKQTLMTPAVNETQNQHVSVKDVEVKVTVEDVSKGFGLNQLTMKSSNSITTQTVQNTPQLKQEIFTQILDAIKGHVKLSDHGTSMLIKLQPEQLGNVELKLNLQKGIVLAEIKVENEMVKAAIESNLDDLKQSLSNKGYSIDQLNVSVDSGKKNRQETFSQSKRNKSSNQKDTNESVELIDSLNRYLVDDYEGSTINYYG